MRAWVAAGMGLWAVASASQAQVTVNQVDFPSNIGRTFDAAVTIDYVRTSSAAAVIRTVIPPQLGVLPPAAPAGCRVLSIPPDTVMECDVPAGNATDTGTVGFSVRGAALGSFNLTATATGGSSAANAGTVRSSGDVTVSKTRAPAGNLLAGQTTTFTLRPQLAAGADDLPAGATLTVTDQLPGTTTDFVLSAVGGGAASCNGVAAAQASRTLTCTYTGPLSAAALNAESITVTGTPGTSGNFTNVGSVAATQPGYFDRDANNNTANANYTVDPASDLAAGGSFPPSAQQTGATQNLVISGTNNGPMALPAGSTVSTIIPAGFTVNGLPAGCNGPATGVVLVAPATVTCTTGALANAGAQSFTLPLTMPATPASGAFTVTVATPVGYGDANAANNTVLLPYAVLAPYADLKVGKAKSPASGPIAAGAAITTTLTVTNDAGSPSPVTWSANGGGTELRVIDYLRPEEIAGGTVGGVTAGWNCSVADATDPADASRTKRVTCVKTTGGTMSPGQSQSVAFTTTAATVVGQVRLANRACTGETMLTELGLTPAQGPQPAGAGQTGNDCATAGGNLVVTDVVSGQAVVTVVKESSADGATWVDPVGSAPTITSANDTARWRVTITTPAGGAQATIPTLNLSDTIPGILATSSPGAPAPAYQTPAITVGTSITAGSATGACPNVAAGTATLSCSFTNVAPGTTIVVQFAVQRPFASGTLTNTATVTSPDAILSGTQSDAAALIVQPRVDIATTTKTVTPAAPRIGQSMQFTITAQNLGPDDVANGGDFTIVDDLNTSLAGSGVAFADIAASGTGMSCAVAGSALPGEDALAAGFQRVRCVNTGSVARYSTRTITITARVQKPLALPPSGNVYTGQINTAVGILGSGLCEYKTETSSNGSVSAACNDAAATSNNRKSISFDVLVPQIDLQQRKARVLPAGQTQFGVGQPLRYRFRLQNNGPSRAEGVSMTDRLTVPAGFVLSNPQVFNVNGVAAESGYTLDATKAASVSCTQAAAPANADLVCTLGATSAASYLDANREVNFEVEFTQVGESIVPVTVSNQALACADEASGGYESSGSCNRTAANNNNVAQVNDTIFPRTDLAITKTTVTTQPLVINQPVAFDLQVRNLGPHATQQVIVTDRLPANFEFMGSGAQAPTVTLGSFVTAAPSTVTGANVSCTASPAAITTAGQQQTVTCAVNALPGPYGAGAFPGNADAGNTITVRLWARAKAGLFAGPYASNLTNSASVSPGNDPSGTPPLSIDTVPGNNTATSTLQVSDASIAGRVFNDRNGNGTQDGTTPALDEGIGNVTLTLTGTDIFGNAVTRTTTTVNAVGATRGDYLFDHLPPGSYTVTETQPPGFVNSAGTPAAPASGSYAAAPSATTSTWTGITLGTGQAATGYLFPESLPGATISGTVFVDRDGSGTQGTGEPGIPGVTLALYPAGTTCPASGALPAGALASTTTDANGNWQFANVTSGNGYVVCEAQPAGYGDATPTPGTAGSTPRANQIDIASLPLGGAANQRFPEVLASLAGKVFVDYVASAPGNANNGTQEAGEPGLGSATAGAGVPVTLTGTPSAGPNAGTTVTLTTTTAADGSYAFADLFPGSYTVTEGTVPKALGSFVDGRNTAGTVSAGGTAGTAGQPGDNAIRGVVLPAGGSSTGNNFAELPGGTISGQVFADGNNDATRQPLEGGYAGQTITLTGTDVFGHTVTQTVVTDANGGYRFTGLPPGTYTVTEPGQPLDSLNGSNHVGSTGGTASNPAAGGSVIAGIPLGVGQSSTGNDFGEVPTASSIAGRVWLDGDHSGTQDSGEAGIPGVTVRLTGSDILGNPVDVTVTTDANGDYLFRKLAPSGPGGYTVTEPTQPAGTVNGVTQAGTAGGTATPVTTTPSRISTIPLGALQVSSANNFGEVPNGASLSGRVWLDTNHNGVIDGSEAGIAGVTLQLTGTDITGQPVSRTVVTDATGAYRFDTLPPSNGAGYTVTEPTQPAGTFNGITVPGSTGGTATGEAVATSVIGGVVLAANQASVANNFGEIPPAEVSGRVYFDNNNNGAVDAGEVGIAGVTVTLSGTDDLGRPVTATTTTAPDGSWRFPNLRPGTYAVTEPTQPTDTLNGITTAGVLGGTATAVATVPSAITAISVPAGGIASGNLFGELGNSPDLRVAKRHSPATLTVANAATYTITVRNAGQVGTTGVYTVSDRLPTGVTLTATPSGTGWACTAAADKASFSCTSSAVIAAGSSSASTISAPVTVSAAALNAAPLVNAVMVEGGGEIAVRGPSDTERGQFNGNPALLPLCDAAVVYNACRDDAPVQNSAAVSGTAWLDVGTTPRQLDAGDTRLPGWTVEVLVPGNPTPIATATTDASGNWRVANLIPGVPLQIRYRDPVSGVVFGYPVNGNTGTGSSGAGCDATAAGQGKASSCTASRTEAGNSDPVLNVVLAPGAELPQQSLPVDPTGVVYDSGNRQPVPGSTVTLAPVGTCTGWDPATQVVGATLGGYTVNGGSVAMTVGASGAYQFLFGPNAPASCNFTLTVTPPAGGGYAAPSTLIPAAPGTAPSGAKGSVVSVQPQAGPPAGPVGPATVYYTTIVGGSNVADLVNNHLPLDPAAPGAIALRKTGDRAVVEVGDTVRYTIVVQLATGGNPSRQTTIVDRLPPGLTYVKGTAMVGGVSIADPAGGLGPVLAFQVGGLGGPKPTTLTLQYRVRVGVGSQQGDGINRAQAFACQVPASCVGADGRTPITTAVGSNQAQYQVRITGGVFGTDACLVGKVFVDCNGNHVQDGEELGIPGVRLVLTDGTTLISDVEGKYSVCGLPPRSHAIRIDPGTLPRGSRLTTSSNRNLGDAGSLWLDLKNGELHRADFVEGSCSNTVLEQVKARRAQGEVRAPETEKPGTPALRFDSKAHGLTTFSSPLQGTDGANQLAPRPRGTAPADPAAPSEQNKPTPALPMNQPPPTGRPTGTAPQGGSDASR